MYFSISSLTSKVTLANRLMTLSFGVPIRYRIRFTSEAVVKTKWDNALKTLGAVPGPGKYSLSGSC